jgi:cell division protease FtsH
MVTELGMSETIGPINYAERQGSDFLGTELMRGRTHSEQTAREIDEEVRRVLEKAYQRAEEIVRHNRESLERVAQALLAYETVNGDDVARLMRGDTIESLRPQLPTTPAPAPAPERKAAPQPGKAPSGGKLGELPGAPGLSPA